jgi:hypothetical protein
MRWVQNASGSNIPRFGVMTVAGVVIAPATNLLEFQQNAAFIGSTPATSAGLGHFCIAYEPIAAGQLGRAWIFGVCPVQVNFVNADDQWADVTDGDSTALTSGPIGGAQVLWRAPGTSTQWALVRFGPGPGVGGYPCKITAVDAAAQYTATIYAGTTTAVAGTALSMPAGLTAGATVTVCNLDENALTGNRLDIGSWVYAYPTSSPTVFWTHGGVGSRSTPKSLPYSDPTSTTADTATWDRDTDGVALNLTDPRIVWDPDALLLHVFTRKKYYDARGLIYHVDGEVDAPVTFTNCTAGS